MAVAVRLAWCLRQPAQQLWLAVVSCVTACCPGRGVTWPGLLAVTLCLLLGAVGCGFCCAATGMVVCCAVAPFGWPTKQGGFLLTTTVVKQLEGITSAGPSTPARRGEGHQLFVLPVHGTTCFDRPGASPQRVDWSGTGKHLVTAALTRAVLLSWGFARPLKLLKCLRICQGVSEVRGSHVHLLSHYL